MTDTSHPPLRLEPEEDPFSAEDGPELPELPAAREAKQLLGLLLAVYPEEMEDNPQVQVHSEGECRK